MITLLALGQLSASYAINADAPYKISSAADRAPQAQPEALLLIGAMLWSSTLLLRRLNRSTEKSR